MNVYFLNPVIVVDNLKPTEIVVSFSALSRWHDPPPQGIEETKSHTNLKGKKGDPEKELTTITSSSVMEGESYLPLSLFMVTSLYHKMELLSFNIV